MDGWINNGWTDRTTQMDRWTDRTTQRDEWINNGWTNRTTQMDDLKLYYLIPTIIKQTKEALLAPFGFPAPNSLPIRTLPAIDKPKGT